MKLSKIVLVLFLVNGVFSVFPQTNEVEWETYYYGNNIYAIDIKDDDLWVGTNYGVAHLSISTEEITLYSHLNTGIALEGNRSIFIKRNGRIAVGGWRRAGVVEFTGSVWKKRGSNYRIYAFEEDQNFSLWTGSMCDGIAIYPLQGYTERLRTDNSGLPNDYTRCMKFDNNGILWIGTEPWDGTEEERGGLVKFDGENWVTYNKLNSAIPSNQIYSLDIDKQNNVWIGTRQGGFAKFDNSNWQIYDIENSPLPSNDITAIRIDSKNKIWVGTDNKGAASFDGTAWDLFDRENSGLESDHIRCIGIDSSDNVWFGTANGLAKYDGQSWKNFNTSNCELTADGINEAATDKNGNVWFRADGYYDKAIRSCVMKYDGNEWTSTTANELNLRYNSIRGIAIDNDQSLWIASLDGLHYCVQGNWGFTRFPSNPRIQAENMSIDYSGNIWVGTYSDGVVFYDGENWTYYNSTNSPLPGNHIVKICFDLKNTWIVTENGIAKFDSNKEWEIFTAENSGLPSNNVNTLYVDYMGELWIGTREDGLIHYDNKDWSTFDVDNSNIPSNFVSAIVMDNKHNIYVGCREYRQDNTYYKGGFGTFNNSEWKNFTYVNSPLISNSINDLTCDIHGNIWIASSYGLSVYRPDSVEPHWEINHQCSIDQNYPNPFNSETLISYSVDKASIVKLYIVDILGNKISTLVNDQVTAGMHNVIWNGRTNSGSKVASGIYICVLETLNSINSKKIVYLK